MKITNQQNVVVKNMVLMKSMMNKMMIYVQNGMRIYYSKELN